MDRTAFLTAFGERLRFVLQKHEREVKARAERDAAEAHAKAATAHTDYINTRLLATRDALTTASTNLDAAILECGEHLYDVVVSLI